MVTRYMYIKERSENLPEYFPKFKLRYLRHFKKSRRAEGARIFWGEFRVKNHDFTPKKIIFFPILGGVESGVKYHKPLNHKTL